MDMPVNWIDGSVLRGLTIGGWAKKCPLKLMKEHDTQYLPTPFITKLNFCIKLLKKKEKNNNKRRTQQTHRFMHQIKG